VTTIIALLLVLFSQQPPQRDRSSVPSMPPPTGTASISGSVVAADDGHPLALANVVLIGTATGTLKLTSTDRNGQFVFANLAGDRYLVAASKPPYIGAVAGARRAARPGTPMLVASGQPLKDVTVALPRGATIAGTIYDEAGQPAIGASVILQQWKMQGDERALGVPSGFGAATVDETGHYRFYGVAPGEYLVAAMRVGPAGYHVLAGTEFDRLLAGEDVDVAPDSSLRAVPFFYPGTPRTSEASPIVVGAGEAREGVDLRVGFVHAARVEGLVVGTDGQAVPNVSVQMTTAAGTSPLTNQIVVRTAADGRFSLGPTVPGLYALSAIFGTSAAPLYAVSQADSLNGDVSGVQLTLRPPITIAGLLRFDAGSVPAPSPASRVVPVRRLSRASAFSMYVRPPAASETGAFRIEGVTPGRYLIGGPMYFGASTDSVTWSLKSVMADGTDITDRQIEIGSDAPPKLITVTYTDQWQQLSGTLSHQSGAAATDETVIVFPADRAFWYQDSRRIITTRPGTDGLFSVGGPGPATLPAGDYLVAAVLDLGRDEQFDPSLLATLVPAAAAVTIGPGEKKVQDLVIR